MDDKVPFKPITYRNLTNQSFTQFISSEEIEAIKIHDQIFPFRTNNYVTNQLINWDNYKDDPIYNLTFPRKDLIHPKDFRLLKEALSSENRELINNTANEIRKSLNPHPANQVENVPIQLLGTQHKYRETILFFPKQGQTCHAYCTFCFRWPQFTNNKTWKFETDEIENLLDYIRKHEYISDILFTGGDPMVMKFKIFENYISHILKSKIKSIKSIRIGTKSLAYWPYKFTNDSEAQDILTLFSRIVQSGIHLTIMAHFSHTVELSTPIVKQAIEKIKKTGAIIRSQTPLIKDVNDSSSILREMWQDQVSLGIIPYYLFIPRDTGSKYYQSLTLIESLNIYKEAYKNLSGLARTVRGPVMSTSLGKIQINGVMELNGNQVFVLEFTQAKDSSLVKIPFLAKFDDKATWIDDLTPAFGNNFIDQRF